MVFRPNIEEQLCFVLMPFQDLHQQYFRGILEPAVESLGLKAKKADDIYGTSPIIHDIWQLIWQPRIVIADVTNKNPNVNYELGLCHALGVPTILITQDMADVPFDYRHLRCIVYDTRQVDWQDKLKHAIVNTIKVLLAGQPSAELLQWPYDTNALKTNNYSGPFIPADEAREPLSRAFRQAEESISRALGMHGTSVSGVSRFGTDKSYRSGIAIASALSSYDTVAFQGLEQVRSMGREVVAALGDGTKSAILIFCEMVVKGFSAIEGGAILRDLIHEMDLAVEYAVSALMQMSQPVDLAGSLAVAITAALGDESSGELVHAALHKSGNDGVITIEESSDLDSELTVQEGMYFNRGFVSRRFLNDEPNQLAVLAEPFILLCTDKLASMKHLLPLLEQIARLGRSLLVIADDIEGEALATLEANQIKGTLLSVAVRAPGGTQRQENLEDIAVATGGTVISHSFLIEEAKLSQMGQAEKVEVTGASTWIIGGHGGRPTIESRAAGIRQQIAVAAADYDKQRLQERLAKLVGAIAIIQVGGASTVDREERKYRIENALHATRSAIAKGALPGGGTALWRISKVVQAACPTAGGAIISEALMAPLLAQIKNARVPQEPILREMESRSTAEIGFNAANLEVSDLFHAGVLDSTEVLVRGLQIAFAHARKVLQTGAWEVSPSATPN